jgi:hypothetical protein
MKHNFLSQVSIARGSRAQLFVGGKLVRLFMLNNRARVQHRSAAAAFGR